MLRVLQCEREVKKYLSERMIGVCLNFLDKVSFRRFVILPGDHIRFGDIHSIIRAGQIYFYAPDFSDTQFYFRTPSGTHKNEERKNQSLFA